MTTLAPRRRLEVWGDPIAHSLSPSLHAAAYATLGLDWEYGRRRVGIADFEAAFTDARASLRGVSCTMPLKEAALRAATTTDRRAQLTGAVNTLLFADDGRAAGYNTDVGGLVNALREHGVDEVADACIVGAGATASSALVALAELGARTVTVLARRPERAAGMVGVGEEMGVAVHVAPLDGDPATPTDVTIGTLPGGAQVPDVVAGRIASRAGVLLDVAYSPWPSALAQAWERAGGTAVSGLSMLLHQALLQVRIFVTGDPSEPVDREGEVLASMRSALMGD